MNRPIVALSQQPGAQPGNAQPGNAQAGNAQPGTAGQADALAGGAQPAGQGEPMAVPVAAGVGTATADKDPHGVAATLRAAAEAHAARAAGARAGTVRTGDAASAGTAAASAATAAQVKPRVFGLRIGPAQIVGWQLSVVAVAIAAGRTTGVLVGTAAAALLLVAATTVSIRGSLPPRWAAVAVAYLLRRRRADLPDDAAPALLQPWLGPTTISATAVRDRPLALISHRTAASALLKLEQSAGGASARSALAALLGTGTGSVFDVLDEQPVEVVAQLVIHAGLRRDRAPRAWFAVGAGRSADVSTDEELTMVVRNAVRRVLRHLERAGATAVPVDDREAATTLVALAHAGAGRRHVRERWTTWSAGPVSQACLRLGGFTRLAPETAAALVDTLISTPTNAAVTVSAGGRIGPAHLPGGATVERHDPVVRVAAVSTGGLDAALTVLGRLAGAYGIRPERLDGRQGPGIALSLPIARTLV